VAALIVKLGYVHVTEVMFVPAVIATVWSGAALVTTGLAGSVALTVIPVHCTTEFTCQPQVQELISFSRTLPKILSTLIAIYIIIN
jgi:short subunit fatty acids transporter